MSVASKARVVPFPAAARSFGRRAILPSYRGVTCLALVRHGQTEKALRVSTDGEAAHAVWVPRAMLAIEPPSECGFLVATLSQAFAEAKGLYPKTILTDRYSEVVAAAAHEAEARAARKRNLYRGHRAPDGRHVNQNAFA